MAFVSEDRRYIQIICGGQLKVYKQTRLHNKYLLTNDVVNTIFKDSIEVEVHRDCCKVFDLIPLVQVSSPTRSTDVDQTRWPLSTIAEYLFDSNICSIISISTSQVVRGRRV